jgi:DNA-binding CsgD family transcriptional regulator/tetratricopeptide (TPR) repeat protein
MVAQVNHPNRIVDSAAAPTLRAIEFRALTGNTLNHGIILRCDLSRALGFRDARAARARKRRHNCPMAALESGQDAYSRRAWRDAYAQLAAADSERTLDAQRLEQLAVAAHCLGKDDESVEAWGRAYNSYIGAGDVAHAALAACWCSFGLLTRGEFALGSGWRARAQELCDTYDLDCPAVGFVKGQAAAEMMLGGDPEAALPLFEEAHRCAERFRDPDGLTLTRLGRAQCLTFLGRPAEGVQLFDQVMVAITTDDVSPLVAGLAFCSAIAMCHRLLDVRRAQEWTALLSRWCDAQPDLVPYRGDCLVHRAEILTLHGAWPEAYVEAERARDWLADLVASDALGRAYYQLGELHRLRGEHREAEAAYQDASKHGGDTQPGLALLRLAQGHVNSAAAAIRRALDETPGPIARAPLLAARVAVALAAGDLATGRLAAEELAAVAAEVNVPLLRAHALYASGAVCLADGDPRAALGALRAAWKVWQELDAPYDAARTRVLIGQACRALDDADTAEMEFDAARWVFEELGAAPDLARVERLSISTPAPAPGGLSLRELQVLRLVAAGKTNRGIAGELFLSEKTVHRHVSNIFTKLEVSSRSAATAYAFEHDLV